MGSDYLLIYLCCAMVMGFGGWLFKHSVDRRIHLSDSQPVSEEVFSARLGALEDRLRGEIAAVKVKLEDVEKFTHHITIRLERFIDNER